MLVLVLERVGTINKERCYKLSIRCEIVCSLHIKFFAFMDQPSSLPFHSSSLFVLIQHQIFIPHLRPILIIYILGLYLLRGILCLWFRTSLIYINNRPTRCNTKQSIYYSASPLYMFRVSTTPIIRSTQNCNYSLRYWSFLCAATSLQRGSSHVGGR